MTIGVSIDPDGAGQYLMGMLDRSRLVDGWLNRVAYPTVIAKQRKRWETEGSSEGETWAPLNPAYAARKLKRFRDYPGAGRKMLIATSNLVSSVTGDKTDNHYKLVSGNRLETGTTISYGAWVNEKRDFVTLDQATIDELKAGLIAYLQSGK